MTETAAAPDAGAPRESTARDGVTATPPTASTADSISANRVGDPASVATSAKKPRGGHLSQIDFVRLVTFAGVILDHVILNLAPATAAIAQGVGLLLRYTRYCFFALTGFVLTYQYRHRDLHAPTFWRRRYKLIGLPFLVWSLFYWLYGRYQGGGVDGVTGVFASPDAFGAAIKSIVYDLITGSASYHLYFLSVSMQIYLVFPAVLWVMKRTDGYHRYLLAISAAVQAWFMFHMVRPPLDLFTHGVGETLWRYLGVTLLPYQFFVFAGCLAAFHFEAFGSFMKRWRWPIVVAGLAVIVATLVYFKHSIDAGEEMFRATNVFMLHNSFAFLAIICVLYIGGSIWQARRSPGSLADTVMRKASDRSFGIYLAHVLILTEALSTVRRWTGVAMGWQIVIAYAITIVLTVFLVEVLRRSPVSLITTGREREDWRGQDPARSAAVGVAAIVVGAALREFADTSIGSVTAAIGALLLVSAAVVAVRRLRDAGAEESERDAATLSDATRR